MDQVACLCADVRRAALALTSRCDQALSRSGRSRLGAAAKAWAEVQASLAAALGEGADHLISIARCATELARSPEAP